MAEGSGFDLGGRLKSLREAHALSQRELAKRAGVSNAIISMIEQNRSSPSVGMLKKLLDGFPISLAEFFALQEAPRRWASSRCDSACASRSDFSLPPRSKPEPSAIVQSLAIGSFGA